MSILTKISGKKRIAKKAGLWAWSLIRLTILIGITFYILYPLLLKLSLTFMEKGDLYDATVNLIPRHFTLQNVKDVLSAMDFGKAFLGSTIASVIATVGQVLSCTLVGYGFARFKFPGRNILFALVILTLIVPPSTIVIPAWLNQAFFPFGLRPFGWKINLTSGVFDFGGFKIVLDWIPWSLLFAALTATGLKNGIYIYIARQYFRNVPKELEEAAHIDGAGFFKTFWTIMLPSAGPILLIIGIFSAVWQWTDVMYSAWFIRGMPFLAVKLDGLAEAIRMQMQQASTTGVIPVLDIAYVNMINSVGTLLVILPLVIFYLFAQRHFVESIERTGIVG